MSQVINIKDLLNTEKFIIQVGIDKDNIPVFVNNIIVKEISYEYSSDYWRDYDEHCKYYNKHEITKEMCHGKIYRKVIFDGISFQLIRIKEEGFLPQSSSYSEFATQENLSQYKKLNSD